MSNIVLRSLLRATARAQVRALSTSSVRCSQIVVDQEFLDKNYPKLGKRDIVGFGETGEPAYFDLQDQPCPAVRFGKNTPEIMALKEKEKGDWKNLTLEERKQLYRHSFRQTLAEKYAPTGEWKFILANLFATLSGTFIVILLLHYYVYPDPQPTLTEEWKRASVKKLLKQNQGFVEGISSKYDYEKRDWK